jgi:hypothetical protein
VMKYLRSARPPAGEYVLLPSEYFRPTTHSAVSSPFLSCPVRARAKQSPPAAMYMRPGARAAMPLMPLRPECGHWGGQAGRQAAAGTDRDTSVCTPMK